jgi:hypothetical protein
MSYAITPTIMVLPKEDKIEDTWDYRLGVLIGMIYDDNPFTKDYYHKTHIPMDYIDVKFSDKLMSIMMLNQIDIFQRVYRFCKTHNITITYTSGMNLWFSNMIKNNAYEMVHDEMATMKLNNDNIILLKFGKPSKTLNKLKEVFKFTKMDMAKGIECMLSTPSSKFTRDIDIYKCLHHMTNDNITSILYSLYAVVNNAYNMEITHLKLNPDLIFMLMIMVKKRNMNCVYLNTIIQLLEEITAIPFHQIAYLKRTLYAMAYYYSSTKSRKIFI